MPISVACPECGRHLKAPDALAGKRARCPRCRTVVDVPLSATVVAVDEPSAIHSAPASVDIPTPAPIAAEVTASATPEPAPLVSEPVASSPPDHTLAPEPPPTVFFVPDEPIFPAPPSVADARPADFTVPAPEFKAPEFLAPQFTPLAAELPAAEAPAADAPPLEPEAPRRAPVHAWEEHVLPPITSQWQLPRSENWETEAAPPAPARPWLDAPASPAASFESNVTSAKPEKEDANAFLKASNWPKLFSPPPPNTGFLQSSHQKLAAPQTLPEGSTPSVSHQEAPPTAASPANHPVDEVPKDKESGEAPAKGTSGWRGKFAALFIFTMLTALGVAAWQRETVQKLLHDLWSI